MSLIDNMVTRFPNGVTNHAVNSIFNALKNPDPRFYHTFFDDFDTYAAGDWVVTEGQGNSTQALLAGDGGLLALTNAAADDDNMTLQKLAASFTFTVGKKLFYACALAVNDAVQSDFQFGLVVTDTTPLDATDGVYFQSDDGSAAISFIVRQNATTGSTSAAAIATLVSATRTVFQFFYDGLDRIYYAVGGTVMGYITATPTTFLPDTDLTVSFYIQNGEAVAKSMTIDYVFAAKER